MYVCMYVCVCMCMYVYVCMYVFTHVVTSICVSGLCCVSVGQVGCSRFFSRYPLERSTPAGRDSARIAECQTKGPKAFGKTPRNRCRFNFPKRSVQAFDNPLPLRRCPHACHPLATLTWNWRALSDTKNPTRGSTQSKDRNQPGFPQLCDQRAGTLHETTPFTRNNWNIESSHHPTRRPSTKTPNHPSDSPGSSLRAFHTA